MTIAVHINGFRMGPDTPLEPGDAAWEREIPQGRQGHEDPSHGAISYGSYFSAIRTLLARDGYRLLTRLLSVRLGREIAAADLATVNVYLEKHGEFYHPARIEASVAGEAVFLVLNGAFSRAGRATAEREFHLLKTLNDTLPASGIPQVYWQGELPVSEGEPPVAFIGEWFGGYHEFHWSRDPADQRVKLMVWDPHAGPRYLPDARIPHLFARASEILTGLYNPHTFTQVFPWHHAAGDFVVNDAMDPLDVRLITVRNHVAFIGTEGPPDDDTVFQGLLLFFLVTGIRMRLDRLDGVGDLFWAPPAVAEATVRGFFRALAHRKDPRRITNNDFLERLSVWSAPDLMDIADPLAELIALGADETALIRRHLETHLHEVAAEVDRLHRMSLSVPDE